MDKVGYLFHGLPFEETYLFSDIAVFIDIVKVESPVELFLDRASQKDRKAHHKILQ